MQEARKILGQNKKAYFNYEITEKLECGIVLEGTEVKALREGHASFVDSFAQVERGEVWLRNFNIAKYEFTGNFAPALDRKKKLLLHKEEIRRLQRKTQERGFSLVPLDYYLIKGKVKLTLALCRGKKQFDKRASLKDRDVKRDIAREFKKRLNR